MQIVRFSRTQHHGRTPFKLEEAKIWHAKRADVVRHIHTFHCRNELSLAVCIGGQDSIETLQFGIAAVILREQNKKNITTTSWTQRCSCFWWKCLSKCCFFVHWRAVPVATNSSYGSWTWCFLLLEIEGDPLGTFWTTWCFEILRFKTMINIDN